MKYLLLILLITGCDSSGSSGEIEEPLPEIERVIINEGVPGNNTDDVLLRLDEIVMGQYDLALVMIGTNDALNSQKQTSLEDYEANLREIVLSLENAGARVVLMTIPPAIESYLYDRHPENSYYNDVNSVVSDYNSVINRVGDDYGVSVIDINSDVIKSDANLHENKNIRSEFTVGVRDGVHLTDEGYILIAENIKPLLREAINIVAIGDSITYGHGGTHPYTYYL